MAEYRSTPPLSFSDWENAKGLNDGVSFLSEPCVRPSGLSANTEKLWFWRILDRPGRAFPELELEFAPAEEGHQESTEVWTARVHSADLRDIQNAIEEHRQGSPPCHIACRLRGENGEHRWYVLYGQSVDGSVSGDPRRLLGWVRDIDEVKQLESRCSTLEERYYELFEGSHDLGFTTDLNGTFEEFNRAAERITGYSPGEARSRRFFELVSPEERPRLIQHTHAVLGGGEAQQGEWTLLTRSGARVPVELSLRLLFRRGRPHGLQGLARDISERKQHEAALRELSSRLLQAQDDEQRRLARELHDATAQELAAISMNLGHLQASEPGLSQTGMAILNESVALAQQCAREVRTMSYLLHPPLLDEAGLEAAIRWFCQGFASRSGIELRLDVPAGFRRLPSEIETALFRIVQEALTNIHRHSGSLVALVRLRRRHDRVSLSICDKGKGIAREQLRAIRSGVGGAGVGLPGMRERVRKLGGSFTLRSRSIGLTILVSVPYKENV